MFVFPFSRRLVRPPGKFIEYKRLHASSLADNVRRRLTETDAEVPKTFQNPVSARSKQLTTGHRVWHSRQYIRFRGVASEEIGNAVRVAEQGPKAATAPATVSGEQG
jgi:hypothetical protein